MSLICNDNFKWFLIRDNFLSPEECEKQIELIDKCQLKKVVIDDKELLSKLWNIIKLSNDLVYKFDISGIQNSWGKSYSVDSFKEDEHYHTDFAAGPDRLVDTTTKLTSVVFLNDDYDGGELEIWGDKVESKKGRIVIFPSFAAHKVLQFSKKDRKMLITFIEGNTFK